MQAQMRLHSQETGPALLQAYHRPESACCEHVYGPRRHALFMLDVQAPTSAASTSSYQTDMGQTRQHCSTQSWLPVQDRPAQESLIQQGSTCIPEHGRSQAHTNAQFGQ